MTSSPYRDAVLADSPVGYWRLNESTGQTTAVAQVGSNATWVNGTSESVPGPFLINPKDNSASRFASTKHLNAANPKTVPGAGTIECWLNVNTFGNSKGIWQNTTQTWGNPANGVSAFLWDNGALYCRVVGANGVIYDITGPWTNYFTSGSGWNHMVWTYGAGTQTLYVNAVVKATSAVGSMPSAFPSPTTVCPARGHDRYGNGLEIDEFAVYDTALTATRVKAHYDASFIPPGIEHWTDRGSKSAMVMG